jgi:Spy/CpxP family protein refolding chaperone
MAVAGGRGKGKLFFVASVFIWVTMIQPTSNSSMKSILKLSLAAMLLGLSVTGLLRADDQPAPTQPGPSIQPDQPPPPDSGGKPKRMMNPQRTLQRLSEQLNLTDDQKTKILPLLQAQADQLTALHNDTSLSDDDKHEKARAIMQSTREQIGALLTPEQKEKFKSMRGAHGNGPPPPPADNAPPTPPPST